MDRWTMTKSAHELDCTPRLRPGGRGPPPRAGMQPAPPAHPVGGICTMDVRP